MKNRQYTNWKILALLGWCLAGIVPSAFAATTGGVDISKVNDDEEWILSVTNTTAALQVVGFAIAENEATTVDGRTEAHGWWDAGIIRESEWNFGVDALRGLAGPFVTLTDFDSTFGTDPGIADRAVVYWLSSAESPAAAAFLPLAELMVPFLLESGDPDAAARIFPGETAEGFTFTANTAGSPFAALLSTGLPGDDFALSVATGEVSLVPLPAAAPLLLSALLLLGRARRRC